jgi:outer membrane protein TolC
MRTALVLILAGLLSGCSRAHYRRSADRETYGAIRERTGDPRWDLPRVSIAVPPESRLFDPFNPDCPPLPPDDPAAHVYMHHVDGMKGYKGWHKNGDAPWIEDPHWREYLDLSDDGELVLTPERAVELGVLHSREYQTQLEGIYVTALALTLERFAFDLQFFGRNSTFYNHFGSGSVPTESNTLTTTSNFGFTRALSTGGQLLVDFANTFVFEFTGPNRTSVTSNIVINFVQPLLRGAWREVALERLTQAERNVLYAVRDFARFRKVFYFGITQGGNGFLALLLQQQTIRNQEANLVSLEQNLRLYEALLVGGGVAPIFVDQVFQTYQQGQVLLLQARTNLENSLDAFKILLGLPPSVRVRLDDSLLAPFQLNDPALTGLQDEIERFLAAFRQLKAAPPLSKLREGFAQLKTYNERTLKLHAQVEEELQRWQEQLRQAGDDKTRTARQRAVLEQLTLQLPQLRDDLEKLGRAIDATAAALSEDRRTEAWQTLHEQQGRQEISLLAQLFVIQTQIRVYLIRLRPIPYELAEATQYALANRLDLMNQRAQVVDAWRQITVTADGLESDLDLVFNANIATVPGGNNPVKFSAAASSYRVGLQFDSPLNRKIERNVYRASLINYQQARRAFMALDDRIQQAIRRDVRQLETDGLNFEIARQSLIVAARQVEEARERVRVDPQLTDIATQNVLNALNSLLLARNTLISTWVNYETGRLQLLLDMEALQLDERGVYVDEHKDSPDQRSAASGGPLPPPPEPAAP